MDLSKLTTGDKVFAGSGIALLIFSFFPWFGFDAGPFVGDYTESAWSDFLPILAMLLTLALLALLFVTRFTTTKLPDIPVTLNQVFLIGGIVVFAILLLKLLIGGEEGGVDLDRRIGVFLGVLAAAGMAVGGWLKSQEPAEAGTRGPGPGSTPPTPF